jgi:hypothetical protein
MFVLLLGLLANAWPAWASGDSTAGLTQTADRLIIPAYRQLETASVLLRDRTESFCKAPDETALEGLKSAFGRTMEAWQSVQHIRFGPVEYLMRGPRFQLWPDKRGSVSKHLSRLLASADRSALEPERFAQGSVAVQGLGALEVLLFDSDVEAVPNPMSRSTTSTVPSNPTWVDRYQAMAEPIIAPPTMTTS